MDKKTQKVMIGIGILIVLFALNNQAQPKLLWQGCTTDIETGTSTMCIAAYDKPPKKLAYLDWSMGTEPPFNPGETVNYVVHDIDIPDVRPYQLQFMYVKNYYEGDSFATYDFTDVITANCVPDGCYDLNVADWFIASSSLGSYQLQFYVTTTQPQTIHNEWTSYTVESGTPPGACTNPSADQYQFACFGGQVHQCLNEVWYLVSAMDPDCVYGCRTSNPSVSMNLCACGDTDGGNNPGVQGTLHDYLNIERTDSCTSSLVREYYCDAGEINGYDYDDVSCPTGQSCVGGECEQGSTCTDSDGQDKTVAGYVISGGTQYDDYCQVEGGTYVWEYICSGGSQQKIALDCDTGTLCYNGACSAPGCTDSDGQDKNVAGTVTYLSTDYDDYCDTEGGTYVKEFVCPFNELALDCDAGTLCYNGACSAPSCTDTDGQNKNVAGTVTYLNDDYNDYCDVQGSSYVWEYICPFELLALDCDTGTICDDGACSEPDCMIDDDCDDINDCTVDACTNYVCSNTDKADGTSCETSAGEDGECEDGECIPSGNCPPPGGCDPGEIKRCKVDNTGYWYCTGAHNCLTDFTVCVAGSACHDVGQDAECSLCTDFCDPWGAWGSCDDDYKTRTRDCDTGYEDVCGEEDTLQCLTCEEMGAAWQEDECEEDQTEKTPTDPDDISGHEDEYCCRGKSTKCPIFQVYDEETGKCKMSSIAMIFLVMMGALMMIKMMGSMGKK